MNRFVASLMLPAFLLACGGGSNPFEPTPEPPAEGEPEEETPEEGGIPEELAGDLRKIVYDPVNGTVTIEGVSLDETPIIATYRRRPNLDRNGYLAYTAQDDPLDRHYTAFVAQSNNEGAVRGGIVGSGGPRNRVFAGGYYERDGEYDPPEADTAATGLVSYAGNYVGLTNGPGSSEDLRPFPAVGNSALRPSQAQEVTGWVFINADFADNTLEGNILERRIADTGQALPDVVLAAATIDENGEFLGQAEYEQAQFPDDAVVGVGIGSYGGIFGGTDSSAVAGIVRLGQWDGPNDPLDIKNESEFGVFVLDRCNQPVRDPICVNVVP